MRRASRRALALAATLLLAGAPVAAEAALSSEDSAFGLDTITFDSATGLRWLDLTESVGFSHTQMLAELMPGGLFDGYHLATDAEIAKLFTNAGIDLGPLNAFLPQNYAPIVDLTALIGVLGNNGNCGSGCLFSFTAGYTAEPTRCRAGRLHDPPG